MADAQNDSGTEVNAEKIDAEEKIKETKTGTDEETTSVEKEEQAGAEKESKKETECNEDGTSEKVESNEPIQDQGTDDNVNEQSEVKSEQNEVKSEQNEVKSEQNEVKSEQNEVISEKNEEKNEQNEEKTEGIKETVVENEETKEEMKETEKKKEPIKVDLKSLQTHYKPHAKSSLRHVLTEYGMEDKNIPPAVQKEKVKKKKKRVQTPVEDDATDERRSRQAREEKFRQMFGDNRQADQYYVEYVGFLQKKVEQQRLKAQREKEEETRRRAQQLEEEYTLEVEKPKSPTDDTEHQKHRYQRKLQRIELRHDDSFLKDLPKTDMARIVALQDKLRREGKLKCQEDVDKFWRDIKNPDTFYAQFKIAMVTAPNYQPPEKPVQVSSSEQMKDPNMAPRSLSHISEASQSEPWAITQKFASSNGQKTPTGERQRKNSAQLAKEAALDLERRCPKLELPPLACFSLKLKEDPPDPAEIQRQVALKAREKSRKKYQRKLHKMHQMAMTNTAAANRILGQHGDLVNVLEGPGLRDIRDIVEPRRMASYSLSVSVHTGYRNQTIVMTVFDDQYTLEEYYDQLADPGRITEEPIPPISRLTSASSRTTNISSDGGSRPDSKTKRKKKTPKMIEYPEPLPLSFDEMLNREKTMDPKCLSTNWTNYLNAGKSLFAPS